MHGCQLRIAAAAACAACMCISIDATPSARRRNKAPCSNSSICLVCHQSAKSRTFSNHPEALHALIPKDLSLSFHRLGPVGRLVFCLVAPPPPTQPPRRPAVWCGARCRIDPCPKIHLYSSVHTAITMSCIRLLSALPCCQPRQVNPAFFHLAYAPQIRTLQQRSQLASGPPRQQLVLVSERRFRKSLA